MITSALNHEIEDVESFFPSLEKIFFSFKTWEDIKENRGQEPFTDVEEVVFI